MCLVEIKPPPNQRADDARHPRVGREIERLRARRRSRSSSRRARCRAAEGMEVLARHERARRRGARTACRSSCSSTTPSTARSAIRPASASSRTTGSSTSSTQKRMRDEPVHKPKAVVFGPTIVYDAERCVMCTRCIRFMDEVAKDPVLDMRERGNLNEIFVAPGRQLDGHYTFMTEHVCPVGALTTKDFRFKARVWFLRTREERLPGLRDGLQRAPRLRSALQQGLPLPPARQRGGQQVLDVRRGHALVPRGARGPRHRGARRAQEGRASTRALEEAKKRFGGVADGVDRGRPLGAALARGQLGAARARARSLGATARLRRRAPAPGYADDILIDADKNPNTARREASSCPTRSRSRSSSTTSAAGRVTHVIALGGVTPRNDPEDATRARHARARSSSIAAHEGALTEAAHVVLPATSWAEHERHVRERARASARSPRRRSSRRARRSPAWEHRRGRSRRRSASSRRGRSSRTSARSSSARPRARRDAGVSQRTAGDSGAP